MSFFLLVIFFLTSTEMVEVEEMESSMICSHKSEESSDVLSSMVCVDYKLIYKDYYDRPIKR